jgi:hypothetical protein
MVESLRMGLPAASPYDGGHARSDQGPRPDGRGADHANRPMERGETERCAGWG